MRDPARSWLTPGAAAAVSDPGRPIRINLWYPASASETGARMRYGDYLHYEGPSDFRTLDEALERSDRRSWVADLTELLPKGADLAERLFAIPVAARRDATAADGRFPVLLYAAGKGARSDANVELGEYLASHGYVMLTVARVGPSSANLDLGSSPGEILIQVLDLAFAADALKALPFADTSRLAIAGHSAGGIAALQFAMLNPAAAAVVGLDGSYGMLGENSRSAPHRSTVSGFPEYAPERVTASLLDLRRADGVQGATLDSTVVTSLRSSDRYLATFPKMYHGDFTEWAPIAVTLGAPWAPRADGRTRRTAYDGSQHAYRAILNFLEATLRRSPGALDAMTAELRRVPDLTLTHHPPSPLPGKRSGPGKDWRKRIERLQECSGAA